MPVPTDDSPTVGTSDSASIPTEEPTSKPTATSFDEAITVTDSFDESNLYLIEQHHSSSDDASPDNRELFLRDEESKIFNSVSGQKYFLFVSGSTGAEFELSLEEITPALLLPDALAGATLPPTATLVEEVTNPPSSESTVVTTSPTAAATFGEEATTSTTSPTAGVTSVASSPSTVTGDESVAQTTVPNESVALDEAILTDAPTDMSTGDGKIAPTNDACSQPSFLPIGSSASGFTTNATFDETIPLCNATSESPGVWYVLFISGGPIEVSFAASFAARATIYQGLDCSSLACVSTMGSLFDGGTAGYTAFDALETQKYYLHIHGETDSDVGDFNVSVSQAESPPNNVCEGASGFALSAGTSVEGRMRYATNDTLVSCGEMDESLNSGMWYLYQGDDLNVEASAAAGFNMQIIVYGGNDCEDLVCVGASSSGSESSISWVAEEGVEYYIYVASTEAELATRDDVFSLTLQHSGSIRRLQVSLESYQLKSAPVEMHLDSSQASTEIHLDTSQVAPLASTRQLPSNNFCTGSEQVEFGKMISSSTSAASSDEDPNPCYSSLEKAVWYRVRAMDKPIEIKLKADFLSRITVYVGSNCGQLGCVAQASSAMAGGQLSYMWAAQYGEHYHIAVDGIDSGFGNFNLTVWEKRSLSSYFGGSYEQIPVSAAEKPTLMPQSSAHVSEASTMASTESPTEGSTESATQADTEIATEFSTENSTGIPTQILQLSEQATVVFKDGLADFRQGTPDANPEDESTSDFGSQQNSTEAMSSDSGDEMFAVNPAISDSHDEMFGSQQASTPAISSDSGDELFAVNPAISDSDSAEEPAEIDPDLPAPTGTTIVIIPEEPASAPTGTTIEIIPLEPTSTTPPTALATSTDTDAIATATPSLPEAAGTLSPTAVTTAAPSLVTDTTSNPTVSTVAATLVPTVSVTTITTFSPSISSSTVSPTLDGPTNDSCTTSIPLEVGDSVAGFSPIASEASTKDEICTGSAKLANGIWYSFIGTGEPIRVNFDTIDESAQVHLLEGSCESQTLECVDFLAADNADESVSPRIGCDAALMLEVGDTIASSIAASETDSGDIGVCGTSTMNSAFGGIWYAVKPGGYEGLLNATLLPTDGSTDVQVTIFSSSASSSNCEEDWTCIDGSALTQTASTVVLWIAESTSNYYILVQGLVSPATTEDTTIPFELSLLPVVQA